MDYPRPVPRICGGAEATIFCQVWVSWVHRFPGPLIAPMWRLLPPPVNHPQYMERQYFNHKRFHSINVQPVCDSSMRIMNVNARYPGATHDSYMYTLTLI